LNWRESDFVELKIEKTNFYRNPFIGLFLKTNNSITLLPDGTPHKLLQLAESTLETKPVHLLIDQSSLVGIFTALNDNGCVLPEFAEKKETDLLKKQGLNVLLLRNYAPGNNILCNNKACLVNSEIDHDEAKKIGDCLGVEVFRQKTGANTVGAANVVTDKGLLAFNETSEIELKYLEKSFGSKGIVGTTNLGSQYNGISLVANNKGALVGESTTGVEMQRIYEALNG